MTDYEHDVYMWNMNQSKYADFSPGPDRNDYDEHGYKQGSVTYENGLILDNFLINTYGKAYAINNPIGKY